MLSICSAIALCFLVCLLIWHSMDRRKPTIALFKRPIKVGNKLTFGYVFMLGDNVVSTSDYRVAQMLQTSFTTAVSTDEKNSERP